MRAIKLSYSIILILGFSTLTTAQKPPLEKSVKRFEIISTEHGLSSASVNCIFQDSRGFMWIGTPDGLNRYDGHGFKVFRHNPNDSTSLLYDQVVSIDEDFEGQLWISTPKGYCRFNPQTETFQRFGRGHPLHGYSRGPIIADSINSIWFVPQKNWVPDPPYAVMRYNIIEDTCIAHQVDKKGGFFYALAKASNKHAYAYNPWWERIVVHLDLLTGEIDSIRHFQNGLLKTLPKVLPMQFFNDGSMIVAYTNDTIDVHYYHYNPETKKFKPHHEKHIFGPGREVGIKDLWATIRKDSIHLSQCTFFGHQEYHPSCHYESDDGTIWIGTKNIGIGILYPTTLPVENIRHNRKNINSAKSAFVEGVWEDAGEGLWIATAGMDYLDYSKNETIHYNQDGKPPYLLKSIWNEDLRMHWPMRIRDGTFFVRNMRDGDIYMLDERSGSFVNYQTDYLDVNLPFSMQSIPYVDSKGRYFYNSGWRRRDGFVIYYPDTKKIKHFKPGEKGLPVFYCSGIGEDSYGHIWMGTMKLGPVRFDPESEKFEFFTEQFLHQNGSILKKEIHDFYEDRMGNLWIGHDGIGVDMIPFDAFYKDSIYFINYNSTNSGLNGNTVVRDGIVEDERGHIWIATVQGISRFDPSTRRFKSFRFSRQFGALDPYTNFHKGGSGRIFVVGPHKGVFSFHPDSIRENQFIPPVYITGLQMHNKHLAAKGTYGDTLKWDSPIEQSALFTESIELSHKQNDITFEFAALNYTYPEDNQYKYKLEGYQEDWMSTTADRPFAAYTNLSAGDYTFRVIGSNNDGIWNEEGDSMTITIHPPWWASIWAFIGYGALAIGSVLWLRRYEKRRFILKEQARTLKEIDHLKTQFFTNISHEFRTPLTLIQGPIKSMYEGTFKGDPKSVMGMVLRNSQRLLRLINQLLDLSKIEAGSLKLEAKEVEINTFVRTAVSNFESAAKRKQINLRYSGTERDTVILLDNEKMERVLFNLLSNALKFTPEEGMIEVTVRDKKGDKGDRKSRLGAVEITVRDTGKGIPEKDLPKVFDRFYQADSSHQRKGEGTGIGLALARELVELHHGEISVESKEGWGTMFKILLPKGKDHLKEDEVAPGREETRIEESLKESATIELDIEPSQVRSAITAKVADQKLPLVLIVEDNADMRKYILSCLGEGYQVIEAVNGKEGLELAINEVPDMILSDVMMPEMDGYELCFNIRNTETTRHIPLILLTAKADQESRISGLKRGADDYLAKPFDPEELRLKIANQLEQAQRYRSFYSKQLVMTGDIEKVESLDDQFLKKTFEIVEKELDNHEFTVEAFARQVGMSQAQLYRKILALTDQKPNAFIRSIRLKKAAQLILQHFGNVSDVAYAVGFNNLSYFAKCFKKQFGVSPNEYTKVKK